MNSYVGFMTFRLAT